MFFLELLDLGSKLFLHVFPSVVHEGTKRCSLFGAGCAVCCRVHPGVHDIESIEILEGFALSCCHRKGRMEMFLDRDAEYASLSVNPIANQ